jgi:O-antigen/teichoic acid export membrane protein
MGIGEVQRQSIISLISQIGITFVGFFSTMYFAHAVGASVLGAYFLFMAYYGIVSMVTDGGFGGAALKRISEGEAQDEYLSAFFVVRTLFLVVTVIALIAFRSFFVDLDTSGAFIWLLLALILSILCGTVSYGIAGCGKMGIRGSCTFIGEVSRILVQIVAIFLGFGVAGLAGGFVAGIIVAGLIEWRFFDLHFVRFGWRHIKSLSTFSFWLFLTSSGVMLYSYSDTVMIGYFLNNANVGVYRVIFQFTSVALLISTALITTLWPRVSRWGKVGDIGFVEESLSRAFSYSLLFAVPILVGGILLGDKLLYYFYGAEFAQGYPVLVILLIVQLIAIFQLFFLLYLSALDRQKSGFKVTAVSATANVILNFILIPIIGIAGAAVATSVTLMLNTVLGRQELSKIITIRVEKRTLLNILKASSGMVLFVICYRLFVPLSNVWLTLVPVIFGGALYGVLILRLDSNINIELKALMTQMNLPCPYWV